MVSAIAVVFHVVLMQETFASVVQKCFALLSLMLLSVPAAAQDKPNVVLVVMDNLGWGEIGVYGGGVLRGAVTPRLDQLAAEGMQFLNFNVETQCTPSRSALMTGRHPIRSGTTKVVWGQLYGMPRVYNLLTDPKELYDVVEHGGRDGEGNFWVKPAVMKLVMEHYRSLASEPPIPLGTPDPYEPKR